MTSPALDFQLQALAEAVRRSAGRPPSLAAIRFMAARRRASAHARILAAVVAGAAILPPVVAASLWGVAAPSPLVAGVVAVALSLGAVPALTAALAIAWSRPGGAPRQRAS